jgi:hypothetical protein
LPDSIQFSEAFQDRCFNIQVPQKNDLIKKIFSNNLFASSHYEPLDGVFAQTNHNFTKAESLYQNVINLFNDFYINLTPAEQLSELINSHLSEL